MYGVCQQWSKSSVHWWNKPECLLKRPRAQKPTNQEGQSISSVDPLQGAPLGSHCAIQDGSDWYLPECVAETSKRRSADPRVPGPADEPKVWVAPARSCSPGVQQRGPRSVVTLTYLRKGMYISIFVMCMASVYDQQCIPEIAAMYIIGLWYLYLNVPAPIIISSRSVWLADLPGQDFSVRQRLQHRCDWFCYRFYLYGFSLDLTEKESIVWYGFSCLHLQQCIEKEHLFETFVTVTLEFRIWNMKKLQLQSV